MLKSDLRVDRNPKWIPFGWMIRTDITIDILDCQFLEFLFCTCAAASEQHHATYLAPLPARRLGGILAGGLIGVADDQGRREAQRGGQGSECADLRLANLKNQMCRAPD